jgi:hypothetical protein
MYLRIIFLSVAGVISTANILPSIAEERLVDSKFSDLFEITTTQAYLADVGFVGALSLKNLAKQKMGVAVLVTHKKCDGKISKNKESWQDAVDEFRLVGRLNSDYLGAMLKPSDWAVIFFPFKSKVNKCEVRFSYKILNENEDAILASGDYAVNFNFDTYLKTLSEVASYLDPHSIPGKDLEHAKHQGKPYEVSSIAYRVDEYGIENSHIILYGIKNTSRLRFLIESNLFDIDTGGEGCDYIRLSPERQASGFIRGPIVLAPNASWYFYEIVKSETGERKCNGDVSKEFKISIFGGTQDEYLENIKMEIPSVKEGYMVLSSGL